MNKNILKHIIRYILVICVITLCCVIFNFSSKESQNSSQSSGRVAGFLLDTFGNGKQMTEQQRNEQIDSMQYIIRKTAHFLIYMLLGILLMCTTITFKWENTYRFNFCTMFAFLYACTDEFHQTFVAR